MNKGAVVLSADIAGPEGSKLGVTGDICCCQYAVDGGGVAECEDDATDGVRLECRRWSMKFAGFPKDWGQFPTRPDGLLRHVGRTSLNEVMALVRFNILHKGVRT